VVQSTNQTCPSTYEHRRACCVSTRPERYGKRYLFTEIGIWFTIGGNNPFCDTIVAITEKTIMVTNICKINNVFLRLEEKKILAKGISTALQYSITNGVTHLHLHILQLFQNCNSDCDLDMAQISLIALVFTNKECNNIEFFLTILKIY